MGDLHAPSGTIVLPSCRRPDTVLRVVDALGAQDVDGLDVELLVVDNGSTAELIDEIRRRIATLPFAAQLLTEPHPGAAATRNRGVAAAANEVVVFLNDDVLPAGPGWLRGHLALHADRDPQQAVLGPVTWLPTAQITPIMRFLERTGRSHTYDAVTRGISEPAELYANNTSMWRSTFLESGGFDDRFTSYGWQEYDLALRLVDAGVQVTWAPQLLAHHDHLHDFGDALKRAEKVGATTVLFNRIHAGRQGLKSPHPRPWKITAGRVLAPAVTRIPDPGQLPGPLSDRIYALALEAAMARGFARGRRSRAVKPSLPVS